MARISGAVITVPAHFVHSQRNAVIAAAMLAEIPVIDLIDEPIAAALHYRASSLPHGDAKSDADKPVFVSVAGHSMQRCSIWGRLWKSSRNWVLHTWGARTWTIR